MIVSSLRLVRTGRGDAAELSAALDSWTPVTWAGQLHSGDLGWQLRFEDELVDGSLLVARDGAGVAAVGLVDGPGALRLAVDPRRLHDPHLAAVLADGCEALLAAHDGEALVDAAPLAGVGAALADRGWRADGDPWVALHRSLHGVGAERPPRVHPLAGEADVADRVAVQRAAFESSTFSVPRWRLMAAGPAYDRQLDLLARDEDGTPVAAGTAWSAGPGRCGLLEPVGTHRDHQRRGHGARLVGALCAALAAVGASSVAVGTPASNTGAVRAYTKAGFAPLGILTEMRRPG